MKWIPGTISFFVPVAALEQAACSPKTGRDTKRNGFQKPFLFLLFLGPQEYRFQCSNSTCEIDGILLFKGARTLSSWNKMLREGRNARSVKGVVGAPLFVKFVTSRGVLRKAPSWKILLVGKSLQFTWILNILWFANLYVLKTSCQLLTSRPFANRSGSQGLYWLVT